MIRNTAATTLVILALCGSAVWALPSDASDTVVPEDTKPSAQTDLEQQVTDLTKKTNQMAAALRVHDSKLHSLEMPQTSTATQTTKCETEVCSCKKDCDTKKTRKKRRRCKRKCNKAAALEINEEIMEKKVAAEEINGEIMEKEAAAEEINEQLNTPTTEKDQIDGQDAPSAPLTGPPGDGATEYDHMNHGPQLPPCMTYCIEMCEDLFNRHFSDRSIGTAFKIIASLEHSSPGGKGGKGSAQCIEQCIDNKCK